MRPPASRTSSRLSGPRRYESAQRDWNSTFASSCTLRIRNTRLARLDSSAIDLASIEAAGVRALETVEDARLVALGLQTAETPGADVRQALCSPGPPGSASPERRRGRRRAPASAASAAAAWTADSRPAERSRRSRPCRASREGSRCRTGSRIHPIVAFSSSVTKNIRWLSSRCAMEKIETRGLPAAGPQEGGDVERLALGPDREAGRGEQRVDRHRKLRSDLSAERTSRCP